MADAQNFNVFPNTPEAAGTYDLTQELDTSTYNEEPLASEEDELQVTSDRNPGDTSTRGLSESNAGNTLSAAYLGSANEYCEEKGIALKSTVLFGGQVKGYTSAASDVDVIFIVDNETPHEEVGGFISHLQGVEVELGIRKAGEGRFSEAMDRIGAQSKSVFVCKEDDFVQGNVTSIFRSDSPLDSAILDNPLWATDIGLKNILLTAQTVQGEDLLPNLKDRITPIEENDLQRNRRMYTALGLFGIAAYPLTDNATKYSMSSLKWALHSSYFGGEGKLGTLDEEVDHYKEALAGTSVPRTLDRLLELRDTYQKSLRFNVAALFASRAIFNHALTNGNFPVDVRHYVEGEQA